MKTEYIIVDPTGQRGNRGELTGYDWGALVRRMFGPDAVDTSVCTGTPFAVYTVGGRFLGRAVIWRHSEPWIWVRRWLRVHRMSAAELAGRLGVSPGTVRRWSAVGGVMPGGRVLDLVRVERELKGGEE